MVGRELPYYATWVTMVGREPPYYATRVGMVGIPASLPCPDYTTLGIPPTSHHRPSVCSRHRGSVGCGERKPWAQEGETLWVRDLSRPKVVKSVKVGRPLCA